MLRRAREGSSGLVLLVVVGALGVMALLAAAFVSMAQLERKATQQRVYATKALLLARSGIEDALARLSAGQDPDAPESRYGGEDWDADGALSAVEGANELYRVGTLNTADCPVSQSMRSSFYTRISAASASPALIPVGGRQRACSGRFSAGDTYALRLLPAGGIHVNGGDPAAAATAGYNAVLKRILGTLAEAIDRQDGVNDGLPVDQTDGENLILMRPASGWRSLDQIRQAALGGSQARLEALMDQIALDAWVDLKVIAPTPAPALQAMSGLSFQTWADIKLGRPDPLLPPVRSAPGFEKIGAKVVGRAPVDLAWARTSRPALIALIAGLKGLYLDESTACNAPPIAADLIGTLRPAEIVLDWAQPTDDCRQAVARILSSTSDLRTWDQWNAFCDSLSMTGIPDLAQAKRDLLKANFNPNSDLNKFNPDRAMARGVDKSDLLAYSTELNLVPRGGERLSCVGRLTDARGRLLASRTLSLEIVQDLMCRPLTTQAEFVAGDLGSLEVAGDEGAFRNSGSSVYIAPSRGNVKTAGFEQMDPGQSLQTLPEPQTVWEFPATGRPADYDGQVRLATVETESGNGAGGPTMKFLARWERNADASYGGGVLSNQTPLDLRMPGPANSLWDGASPGTLYPDGLYLEKDRLPGYRALGNLAPYWGTICFWMKPDYDVMKSNRSHLYLNHTRHNGTPSETACFTLLNAWPRAFSMHWENAYAGSDSFDEEQTQEVGCTDALGREILAHRWHLLSYVWNMQGPQADPYQYTRIYINAKVPPGPKPGGVYTTVIGGGVAGLLVDFTQPDAYTTGVPGLPPAVFYLGRRGNNTAHSDTQFGNPDATFDELAIWDFGGVVGTAVNATELMTQDRFKAGRYYKESAYGGLADPANRAGEYFSAPMGLGSGGIRLQRLAWTQVVPRDLKSPAATAPEDGDAGPAGRIVLEVLQPSGTAYWQDAEGRLLDTLLTDSSGQLLKRKAAAPFRLHAVFQPNLSDIANTPVLDPLVLDDVTLTYRRQAGPLLKAWREGE